MFFFKYTSLGNDFIIFDERKNNNKIFFSKQKVQDLCDRNFGIGADGLVVLKKGMQIIFFNSDGSMADICGNALLCIFHFLGYKKKSYVKMGTEKIFGMKENDKVTVCLPLAKIRKKYSFFIDKRKVSGILVDTKIWHFVIFVENFKDLNIEEVGRKIRYKPIFKTGVNVDFAVIRKKGIFLRTYEKGVEKETLSCGSGAIATVFCAKKKREKVFFKKGFLEVFFDEKKSYLSGTPKLIFKGEVLL